MFMKYATILALTAGTSLLSHAALAQGAAVPVANMPKQCQELVRKGFTINHETIQRSGTAAANVATHARTGSYPGPRKYGEVGDNKWFVDSFPAHPKEGCRICGVSVAVKGEVSKQSQNNDSITIVGSNTTAPQVSGSPLAFNPAQTRLGGAGPLTAGPYSNVFTVEGPSWMTWYMASLAPSLDVMVQDDTSVSQIEVTYFWY